MLTLERCVQIDFQKDSFDSLHIQEKEAQAFMTLHIASYLISGGIKVHTTLFFIGRE